MHPLQIPLVESKTPEFSRHFSSSVRSIVKTARVNPKSLPQGHVSILNKQKQFKLPTSEGEMLKPSSKISSDDFGPSMLYSHRPSKPDYRSERHDSKRPSLSKQTEQSFKKPEEPKKFVFSTEETSV